MLLKYSPKIVSETMRMVFERAITIKNLPETWLPRKPWSAGGFCSSYTIWVGITTDILTFFFWTILHILKGCRVPPMIPLLAKTRQSLHLHRENCPFLSLCFSSLCVESMLYDFLDANPNTVSCLRFFYTRFVLYVLWHFCFVTFKFFNVLLTLTFMFLNFYVLWQLTFSKI